MPDQPEELTPLADSLRRLAPQAPTLSRDALLFAAGQAAGSPRAPWWAWPSATAFFAGLSVVFGAFAFSPTEIRYVQQPIYIPTPIEQRLQGLPNPIEEPPSRPPAAIAKSTPDPDADEVARMLRVRREVFRWGLDMLPPTKSARDPNPEATAHELRRWLDLPSGTFAAPTIPPKPRGE